VEGADATSEFLVTGRTQLDLSASSGPMSAKFRLRWNENSQGTGPNTMRDQVTWKATDTVAVTLAPSHFGFAGAGVNSTVDILDGPGFGAPAVDGQFDQYSVPVFKVDVGLGGMSVGAGIVTQCGRLCNGDELDAGDQTVVVHLKGSAGSIAYNAAFATGSGTASATADDNGDQAYVDESVSGSGLQLGLTFDGGSFSVGFDYGSQTVGGIGSGDDTVGTFIGLGAKFGDAGVNYTTQSSDNGTVVSTETDIMGAYKLGTMGESGYHGVEVRLHNETDDSDSPTEPSYTGVGYGMRVSF
jgi:hypothetical protein